ncbi:MAG: hypothetical protein LBL95_09410 [Deltaproteobacteria bacterium]|jgi:hypothetical protein|nr:hypothetical protein [Deltaproteobacteria bacterium]
MTDAIRPGYVRVTEVLAPYSNFSMVNAATLARAAERGTRVHAHCQDILLGRPLNGVREDEIGCVRNFDAWARNIDEVIGVERRLYHEDLMLTGQIDIICRLRGDALPSIVDIKTPIGYSRHWRAQLAGYKLLADHHGLGTGRVMTLRLRNKSPLVDDSTGTLPLDTAGFMNALLAHRYFRELDGGKKTAPRPCSPFRPTAPAMIRDALELAPIKENDMPNETHLDETDGAQCQVIDGVRYRVTEEDSLQVPDGGPRQHLEEADDDDDFFDNLDIKAIAAQMNEDERNGLAGTDPEWEEVPADPPPPAAATPKAKKPRAGHKGKGKAETEAEDAGPAPHDVRYGPEPGSVPPRLREGPISLGTSLVEIARRREESEKASHEALIERTSKEQVDGFYLDQTASAKETMRRFELVIAKCREDAAKIAVIDGEKSKEEAAGILVPLKTALKDIEKTRKGIVEAPQAFVKAVNEAAKFFKDRIKAITDDIEAKVSAFTQIEKIEAQKRAEEERRVQVEIQERLQAEVDETNAANLARDPNAILIEVPRPAPLVHMGPPKSVRTEAGTMTAVDKWNFRIADIGQVPREYLAVNETAIRAAIRQGIREIPGVEIFKDTAIRVTAT